jgi:8-oxo-dGTP pyrophosphatase MutT (NUDIX family)
MSAEDGHLLSVGDPRLAARPALTAVTDLLRAYDAPTRDQVRAREEMLAFAEAHPDALQRSSLTGHFTAAALVLDAQRARALLTHHRKLGRWLQLGGHCDGDGNLAAVALREAIEESGIPGLRIDPRPIDLDVHRIPSTPGEPAHLHLDVRFLVHAPERAVERASAESFELAWIAPTELEGLGLDPSVRRLFRLAFGERG